MEPNTNKNSSGAAGDEDTKAATGGETLTRIFVGGLGETVNADDLSRLFNSLGVVEAVEIVRTKGRSFAYVNFVPFPPQDKSLSKLFSIYNGCLWKGGKLKLERAKEHYLFRLKKEWVEDVEQTNHEPKNDFDHAKAMSPTQLPEKIGLEKKFLRIYFPRLRKVKSVPLSGTGKHKYSFQHVEVPPLPVNFCDCEEHSGPAFTLREKQKKQGHNVGAENAGMDAEEIRIMNIVMNKLLERENGSNHMHYEDDENYMESIDDVEHDDFEVESASEEDDLIMNVMRVKKEKNSVGSMVTKTTMGKQDVGSFKPSSLLEEQTQIEIEPDGYEVESVSDEDDLMMNIVTKKRKSLSGSKELKTAMEKQDVGSNQASSLLEKQTQIEMEPDGYEVESLSDEDDLMLNIVTKKRKSSLGSKEQQLTLEKQGFGLNQTAFVDEATHDTIKKQKKKITPEKKRNSVRGPGNDHNGLISNVPGDKKNLQNHPELSGSQTMVVGTGIEQPSNSKSWSQKSSWKELVGIQSNSNFNLASGLAIREEEQQRGYHHEELPSCNPINVKRNIQHVETSENMEVELAKTEDRQGAGEDQPTNKSTTARQAGRGASWWQKSSWTQLVSENNSSFSTSQILPNFFQKPVAVDTSTLNTDPTYLADNEQHNVGPVITEVPGRSEGLWRSETVNQDEAGKETGAVPIFEGKRNSVLTKTIVSEVSEARPFVCSSASLREWKKLKDALSRSRKRKQHDGK